MPIFKEIKPILAFRTKKDASWFGRLTCWLTHAETYHIEMILEDKWISAAAPEGVYVRQLRPLDHDKYTYIELDPKYITIELYDDLWEFINNLNGSKYNTSGLFWNQVIGINTHNDKYYCSELVVEILIILGYKEFFQSPYSPSDYSPDDILRYFKNDDFKPKQYSILGRIKSLFTFKKRK